MSNIGLRVCSTNGYSAVKMTGMTKRGKKSKPKNICRASNETPEKSLTQNSYSEFPILKKKFYERSYNTGKKWKLNLQLFIHFSILMAGIHPISTKVMYTTLQIVLNTQKINYQENIYWQLLNENESACHTYRVWLLSMGSTVTSVFVCLLLIGCSKQRELNYHKLQKKQCFFSQGQFLFLVCH